MKGFLLGVLWALRLPVKLVKGLVKRQKNSGNKWDKLRKKQRAYVYNFSEGRLKNVSWQQSDKKGDKGGKKKYKYRKFSGKKKTNN